MQHPALQSRQPSNRAWLLALLWWLGSSGSLNSIDTFTIFWPLCLWRKSISQTQAPPRSGLLYIQRLHFVGWKREASLGKTVPIVDGYLRLWGSFPLGFALREQPSWVPSLRLLLWTLCSLLSPPAEPFSPQGHALASQGLTKCSKGCKKVLATPCKENNNNKILFEIHTIQPQSLTLLASQLQPNRCCIFTSKVCLCELWTCCI